MIKTSNYLDPATAKALADARRMIQDAKKILNDITDKLGIDISDNSDGLFDIAEVSNDNSDGLYDLADKIEEFEERISALEGK